MPAVEASPEFVTRCRNIFGAEGFDSREPKSSSHHFQIYGNEKWWDVACLEDKTLSKNGNVRFPMDDGTGAVGLRDTFTTYVMIGFPNLSVLLFQATPLIEFLDKCVSAGEAELVQGYNHLTKKPTYDVRVSLATLKKCPGAREYY